MKKKYSSPLMDVFAVQTMGMLAVSKLDQTKDNQTVTPTEEEYNGPFSAPRHHSVWDEEDEEDW